MTIKKVIKKQNVSEYGFIVVFKDKTSFKKQREDFLDMIKRYILDAEHFAQKDDKVNAFAALNYAHGWLDAGARIGLFDVHDSSLFTVD